ncbi:hypothetical protein CMQ_5840 [Grosmannia clavigera kw1407]|uniref:Uncharacterized protein n=1 Tax=Grosmannia clavigera (strain kw1407 / UAMH 11150) TaxID=655863 RepID=F0XIH6_GROCL|nr:uncharacterized protein CMQ_5840 [Grosmannia clavigera kw1407]EFX02479.1 hypothetical protein CMQ_5840 [Grosmannia clavigera kw1407]
MLENKAASTALSTTTTASDGSSQAAVQRPRHQFTRSLSELSSPVLLHRNHDKRHRHDSQEHSGEALSASTPYSPLPRKTPTATASGLPRNSRASLELGRPDGSIPPAVSSMESPSSSRRPSVRISREKHREEARTTTSAHQQPHHHHHHRHHGGHRHRSSGGGSSSSGTHQNIAGFAALAAAATAAAAGSPTPLQIPTLTIPRRASDSGGSIGGSGTSGTIAETARAPLPGTFVPPPDTDPVLVTAMRRLQHDQDRAAARLLQATLADLDGLSTSTGQRLDAVYGSVLSRLSILQGTVQALRSLAISARTTNIHFRAEARSLADEVEQQLAHFEGSGGGAGEGSAGSAAAATTGTTPATSGPLPSDQQRRLEQLHARVLAGRKAVEVLGGRVDVIRERVERWERADLAWQERTRTRLKVLWAIVSGVVLALVVLLVVMARSNKANRTTLTVPDDVGRLVENAYSTLAATTSKHERHLSLLHNSSDRDGAAAVSKADSLVRLFDEL